MLSTAEVARVMLVVTVRAQRGHLPVCPHLTWQSICRPAIVTEATCHHAAINTRPAKHLLVSDGTNLDRWHDQKKSQSMPARLAIHTLAWFGINGYRQTPGTIHLGLQVQCKLAYCSYRKDLEHLSLMVRCYAAVGCCCVVCMCFRARFYMEVNLIWKENDTRANLNSATGSRLWHRQRLQLQRCNSAWPRQQLLRTKHRLLRRCSRCLRRRLQLGQDPNSRARPRWSRSRHRHLLEWEDPPRR